MVLSLRDGLREVTEVATDVQVEGLASAEELVATGATNAIFIGNSQIISQARYSI